MNYPLLSAASVFFCCILQVLSASGDFCHSERCPCPDFECKNATFVTALFDIGRSNWNRYQRDISQYLSYFEKVLALNIHLVVFTENVHIPFVKEHRKGFEEKTKIIVKNFTSLGFYSYYEQIKHVMSTDTFRGGNDMLQNPEGFSPEYVVLMSNKVSFMKSTVKKNPFQTSHFFWLDAGYGHGNDIYPSTNNWMPRNLLNLRNKVTFIALNNPEMYRKFAQDRKLHKMAIGPSINGGFYGGDADAILEFYHLYRRIFRAALRDNVVDDDQGISLLCYFELPTLFNLVSGDWYDVFKLFK